MIAPKHLNNNVADVIGCYSPIESENYFDVSFNNRRLPITKPEVWPTACIKLAICVTFSSFIEKLSSEIS